MNICVIPARGGSKRIPRKNIKNFNGKPIISYSIEAAISSDCFDEIIVSTDDDEIAEVAIKYGAKAPFVRPDKISDDYVGTTKVIKHCIEWMENNVSEVNNVCCLYATAPLIQPKTISLAYKELIDWKVNYCFSVTSFSFPIQRAIKISEVDAVEMFYPKYLSTRSQDLEVAYHDAGQFYWGKSNSFKKELPIFSNNVRPFILPRYLVQDIDTLEDWQRAEAMYRVLKETNALS
jgi:pseudaminic acid cytidylyltransferase